MLGEHAVTPRPLETAKLEVSSMCKGAVIAGKGTNFGSVMEVRIEADKGS